MNFTTSVALCVAMIGLIADHTFGYAVSVICIPTIYVQIVHITIIICFIRQVKMVMRPHLRGIKTYTRAALARQVITFTDDVSRWIGFHLIWMLSSR